MLTELTVPPLELHRPLLRVRFDAPVRTHLASVTWTVAGHEVCAGILAASHQVVVPGLLVETVACDLDQGEPLGDGDRTEASTHRFSARIEQVGADALQDLVAVQIAEAATGNAVVGRFPTHPAAITAIRRDARGWSTVHTYPGVDGGTVVHTETVLR